MAMALSVTVPVLTAHAYPRAHMARRPTRRTLR